MITGAVNRVEPRAIILDVGNNVEAILVDVRAVARRALPDRPERQGVRPRGPPLEPRPADPRQPDPQGLPQAPVRARGPRDPQRHGRDQGDRPRAGLALEGRRRRRARRGSTRSARPSASAARASRPSSPSSAARRSTSSRGTTTPASSSPTRCRPAQVISVDIDEEKRIANVTVPERMLSLAIGREGQNARLAARLTGWRIDIRSDVSVAAKAAEDEAAASDAIAASNVEAGRERADVADRRRRRRVGRRRRSEAEAARRRSPTKATAEPRGDRRRRPRRRPTPPRASRPPRPSRPRRRGRRRRPPARRPRRIAADGRGRRARRPRRAKKTRAKKAASTEEVAS